MKHFRLSMKQCVSIFLLLIFMGGCDKKLLDGGEDKIIGTATINGKKYQESVHWGLTYQGYTSSIVLFENYNIAHFIIRLSPLQGDNPLYSIHCYINMYEKQFATNYPYKLKFSNKLEVETYEMWDILPYLSENRAQILKDGEGFVILAASNLDVPIPVKGELVIEKMQSRICYGYYSFDSLNDDQEKIEIIGKFETPIATTNRDYKRYKPL